MQDREKPSIWHPDFDPSLIMPGRMDLKLPLVLERHDAVPDFLWGSVMLLGNFDGLHIGHQSLLDVARREAALLRAPLAIMSCEPHPRQYFHPGSSPLRLSDACGKQLVLRRLGMDLLYMPRFDASFAGLSAHDFVSDVLVRQLGVKAVVVGQDFRFGRGRSGSVSDLADLGGLLAFNVIVVPDHILGGNRISSSRIRMWIEQGRLDEAKMALGENWLVPAEVTSQGAIVFGSACVLPPAGAYTVNIWDTSGIAIGCFELLLAADRTANIHGILDDTEGCFVSGWTKVVPKAEGDDDG